MRIEDMSLREKIGQTMMIQKPEEYIKKFGSVEKFLKEYPIGFIYFGGDTVGGPMGGIDASGDILNEFKKFSNFHITITGDFNYRDEGGRLIDLPNLMSLGATNSEQLAHDWGVVLGNASKKRGIDWIFAPVADLNINPNNPVVNVRSISDNAELAAKLIQKIVEGIQKCGVAATIKHFPGHGTEEIDPHISRNDSNITKEEWTKSYGKVFSEVINHGVQSVMTAHTSLPPYQSSKECVDGLYNIATLSKELTTDLLKQKMNFNGVVVTDALLMGGFSGSNCMMEIQSFECGSDVLLWPSLEYMDVLEQKILNGEISENRLNDAVKRVIKLKENTEIIFGGNTEINTSEVVKQVAEKSLTLLKNKKNVLPIEKSKIKNVLLVVVSPVEAVRKQIAKLKNILEKYGINVIVKDDIWIPELEKYESECDLTIFAISRTPGGIGTIDVYGDNAVSIWASQAANKSKTIIASFGSPYLYSKYYKHIDTYINAYSSNDEVLEAFTKAIFNEIPFVGKSPVSL